MKLILSLLVNLSMIFQINAQKLTYRQGEVLVEVERQVIPERAIEQLELKFGVISDFEFQQVIAVPMNVWKVTFDYSKVSEREILQYVKGLPTVYNAQLNHIIEQRKVPNDPDFSQQWQYINMGQDGGLINADIDIDDAWELTTGGLTIAGDTIVACVIDDGLDPDHEDFGDNIWINHEEIPENGIDDDGNGYIDDYLGWDTYFESDKIYKEGFHGTPVAGIVGAQGNNELGVAGVNWDVKLMIVRGGGDEANALAAYAYPYIMRKRYNESNGANGAFVVSTNASWGIDYGQAEDAPLWCNFYDSLGMVGIINCGATANNDVNVDVDGDLPTGCSSDYLIAVSNIKRDGTKEQFAGYGIESIDLGAFGSDTYTVASGNDYGSFGGTSAATPHVTGAAALIYSLPYPEFIDLAKSNPAEAATLVKKVLLEGAKKDSQFEDLFVSSGVLNLRSTFSLLDNVFSECPFPLVVSIQNVSLDTTTVAWESPENALTFDLRYKLESAEEWIDTSNVTSPFFISGLEICGNYEVQIKSFCEMDSSSEFSFSERFTSLGCCDAPEGLMSTIDVDIVSANSILMSWEEDQDHVSYTVEYKNAQGEEWKTVTTDQNSISISGLRFCSPYDIRIKAQCITGIETEYSSSILAVTACGNCSNLDYCAAPPVVTAGEWIESVTIDGQKMTTGEDFGYVDNSGFFDIDLNIGTDIELKVDKGFSSGTFDEWVKVWIDLNIDGIFSDEEVVFNENLASENDVDAIIRLSNVDARGYTRMRVGMVFLGEPIACEDPESFDSFGEYEDFCVKLVGPCDYGLSIEELAIKETEATVVFTMVDTSIAYNVRFKKVEQSDDEWTTISVLDTIAMISPLEECTNYVVQVRAVCETDTSGFAAVRDTFMTTGADCIVPTVETDLLSFSIKAFPNPFINELNIKLVSDFSGDAQIEVVNISGQLIYSENHRILIGESKISIEQAFEWNAGIYFVRIKNQEIEQSTKVIKIGR